MKWVKTEYGGAVNMERVFSLNIENRGYGYMVTATSHACNEGAFEVLVAYEFGKEEIEEAREAWKEARKNPEYSNAEVAAYESAYESLKAKYQKEALKKAEAYLEKLLEACNG